MSWTTEGAFDSFYSLINLPGDHRDTANARRDWVVSRLRTGGLDVIESVTMGSIPRFTALKDHADVDVMAVLNYSRHIMGRRPSQVLSAVKSALGPGAGSIRRNGQAVTVTFQSWPSVDVVPAIRYSNNGVVDHYEIPDMNREIWLSSNPPEHGSQINSASSTRGPNFRRVIKMIKDWNRRQAVRLQSYHIEVIALKLTAVDWSDHGWPVFQWFQAARAAVAYCWHEAENVSAYLSSDSVVRAVAELSQAERLARDAWYAERQGDHKKAIAIWRSVFGQRFPTYG